MKLTSNALEAQLSKVRELESRLTFRLSILSKQLDQQVAELLLETPLNLTSYRIMRVVDTFERISISDLSRVNLIDRAQVSRSATELEALGLVEFHADSANKRKKLVALSEQGKSLMNDITPTFNQRQQRLIDELGPDAHAALWQGINKLAFILAK